MELIKINKSKGPITDTVDARELHSFLGVKSRFNDWFNNRSKTLKAEEGREFVTLTKTLVSGGTQQEIFLSVNMALHISMMEQGEKGFQARQYFIDFERKAKAVFQVPTNLKDALLLAAGLEEERERLTLKIAEDKPKVDFASLVEASEGALTMQEFAATIKLKQFGQNNIFRWMKDNGFLIENTNLPKKKYLDQKLFEVIEKFRQGGTPGDPIVFLQTLVTGKGQIYFLDKLKKAS
jgi:anti-repressor protein